MARKILTGIIVSTNMQNAVVVEITRRTAHPLYKKLVRKTKRFKVVKRDFEVSVGQSVKIGEIKQVAKNIFFEIVEVMK